MIISVGVDDGERRGATWRMMWDWNRADWGGYKAYLNRYVCRVDWEFLSLAAMENKICGGILTAARRYVGMSRVNVEGNVGLNAGVRDAIRHRDGLRESGASWEEVKGADGYVQELLKENRCRQ